VLLIHGTSDPIVPFAGGHVDGRDGGGTVLSATATAASWRTLDGCAPATATSALPDRVSDGTTVTVTTSEDCRPTEDWRQGADVTFYTVHGGGHTWPGGPQYLPKLLVGRASGQFDASEVIWQFFASHAS
jgi:polyhydroxybutyrate depolymerase